jgi:hypothetical protein
VPNGLASDILCLPPSVSVSTFILQVFVSEMLDDDIQYMGTRHAPRVVSDSPLSTRQSVHGLVNQSEVKEHRLIALISAIVLHVEKSSMNSPYELIFSRANTDTVHVGRLSSHEAERCHGDSSSALFKCAVVSRIHAKILFSDSGHVIAISTLFFLSLIVSLLGLPHRHEVTSWHTPPQARRNRFQDVGARDTHPTH